MFDSSIQLRHLFRFATLACVAALCFSLGCDQAGPGKRERKLTVAQQVKLLRADLPMYICEWSTLVRVEESGPKTIDLYYKLSDEGTTKIRKVGAYSIQNAAEGRWHDVVRQSSGVKELIADGCLVNNFFEDKYGSHMLTLVLRDEESVGDVAEGGAKKNPFAVSNVSANSGKKKRSRKSGKDSK